MTPFNGVELLYNLMNDNSQQFINNSSTFHFFIVLQIQKLILELKSQVYV